MNKIRVDTSLTLGLVIAFIICFIKVGIISAVVFFLPPIIFGLIRRKIVTNELDIKRKLLIGFVFIVIRISLFAVFYLTVIKSNFEYALQFEVHAQNLPPFAESSQLSDLFGSGITIPYWLFYIALLPAVLLEAGGWIFAPLDFVIYDKDFFVSTKSFVITTGLILAAMYIWYVLIYYFALVFLRFTFIFYFG